VSWSQLHSGSYRHRKVIDLARILGCSEMEARGLVMTLWSWTSETAIDGDLRGWSAYAMARAWGWSGDADAMVSALLEVRLLDGEIGALRVHEWLEYCVHWRDAHRKALDRAEKTASKNVQDIPGQSAKRPRMSKKVRSERRGEERRREEKRGEDQKDRSVGLPLTANPTPEHHDPASGAPPAAPASVGPEPLMLVPLESAQPDSRADDIRAVFAHYRARHPRAFPEPKSTSKEWSAIAARMREGFSLDDLRAAIDGCHMTPHNLGENDRGAQYLGLELIMRNGSQVTRFAETARNGPPRVVMSAREMKGHRATESWLAKKLAAREQQ